MATLFDDLLKQRDATWEPDKRAILLEKMLAIGTFDEIANLREKTFSEVHDRELMLQAILEKGNIDQLTQLNKVTFSPSEKTRIEASINNITYMQFLSGRISHRNKSGQSISKMYDVFIAHASEDKIFVEPLAQKLRSKGLNVWYDDFILKVGMSLRREIDKGIAQSRYGIVVLSKSFFEKDWPQKELDGLSAKDAAEKDVILPIWYKIDKKGVSRYSPTLAGIIAAKCEDGIDNVIDKIIEAIGEKS